MQTSPSERWGEVGKFGFVVIVIIFSSSYCSCFSRIFFRKHLSPNLSSAWLSFICVPSLWALPLVVVDHPSPRPPCPRARSPHCRPIPCQSEHWDKMEGVSQRLQRKQFNRLVTEQGIDSQGLPGFPLSAFHSCNATSSVTNDYKVSWENWQTDQLIFIKHFLKWVWK